MKNFNCPEIYQKKPTIECTLIADKSMYQFKILIKKYPLRKYILGVLTHKTAGDRHWGDIETLKWVLINAARLRLAQYCNAWISASPCLMDPRGLRVTQNAYFSLLTHTKKLLLVTFCYTPAGIGASFRTHGTTDGQTDMKGEIVI